MKLVGYLYKKIFPLFIGSMLFFAFVLNLVDLFMHIANYLQNSCAAKDIATVLLYYIPKTIWYAVPVAILFSTSYVLSDMYANNEMEALLASGVSLLKFTFPLLVLGFSLTFVMFGFENKFVVQTYEKKTVLQDKLLNKSKTENNTDVIVLSDNGKVIYKTRFYTEENKRILDNYFLFRDENKNFETLIYSEAALWNMEEQHWDLQNPIQYQFENNELKIVPVNPEYTGRLTESYEIFRKSNVNIQSLNAKEAKIYIDHLKKAGLPFNEELSEYYKKFAFPFIIFIVVFLSIGLTGRTKKNVLLISLASCIGASVLFYVTMMVTMVLAKHGYISAFMGAWSPVLFFTVVSVILLRYSRT